MNNPIFKRLQLIGVDAQKFLQGQVTLHVERLEAEQTRYTTICNLKGRIVFGFWLTKINAEHFELVAVADQAEDLAKHIKKFGAFSKMKLEALDTVYPSIAGIHTSFGNTETNVAAWEVGAVESGQAWIQAATAELFQPQELRLHQREGIHYDKGCYLGQEVIARLWFKAKPKHWLHVVQGTGEAPAVASKLSNDVEVVNSVAIEGGFKALVVAKPDALAVLNLTVLELPEALSGDVARPQ